MSAPSLNLSSLKDKISSKLGQQTKKPNKKSKIGKPNAEDRQREISSAKNVNAVSPQKDSLNSLKLALLPSGKPKSKTPASLSKDKHSAPLEISDVLRREALELGATEEDLALLIGLGDEDDASEQEFSHDKDDDDQSLEPDLFKFMKGIGLGNTEPTVIDDNEILPELIGGSDDLEREAMDDSDDFPSLNEDTVENNEHKDLDDPEETTEESAAESESEQEAVQVKEALVNNKKDRKRESDKVENVATVVSDKLTVPSRTDWYNAINPGPPNAEPLDRFARERLLEKAQSIVERENKVYLSEFASNNSQKKFLSQILTDGTLNDKISALTLLVQEAPLHNIKALETLLTYCEKKSRTASLQAINAMKDMLVNGILPDRKLLAFDKQPLRPDLTDVELATFLFEDKLKKIYFRLITVLELLTQDPILHVRMSVLTHVFDLLRDKPEQEANLLRLGINKLGDIESKVASKASYQILKLQQAHPAMKKIITDAVIDVVFKPNSDYHAKYYAITTLNQTILTRREEDLANSLVKTYFALFEKVLVEADANNKEEKKDKVLGDATKGRKKKNFKKGKNGGKSMSNDKSEGEIVDEKNARLFSAILTGLNRAFPFSNLSNDVFQSHLDTLFKITHSTNFNTSVQALVLINHIIFLQHMDSDRYYRTLYESLLDSRLVLSSKQGIYLNLLFKSLKADTANVSRVLAFVKRILQVCTQWINVGAITGMLFLLIQLSSTFPQIQDLMVEKASRPDSEEVPELEPSKTSEEDQYDSKKRDPKFAHAEKSAIWEIGSFIDHYHPTIAIYAESLRDGQQQPKPDLGLFTLAHFLDRFVYKNAKQKPMTKGSSIMQPLGGKHTGSLLVKATNVAAAEVPANTEDWLTMKADQIRPDEQFFHQYFLTKQSKIRTKKSEKTKDDEDDEAEEDDDEEIWQALVKSKPEVEEPSDEDGFSELDEADFLSDDDDNEVPELGDLGDDVPSFDEADMEGFGKPIADSDDSDASDSADFFSANEDDELNDSEVEEKWMRGAASEDEAGDSKKRSKDDSDGSKPKRQKFSNLPIFASAEDYDQYLNSEDEDYS